VIARRGAGDPEVPKLTLMGFHPRLLNWLPSGEHLAARRGPRSPGTQASLRVTCHSMFPSLRNATLVARDTRNSDSEGDMTWGISGRYSAVSSWGTANTA